jgi:hypothetical protein
MRNSRGQFRNKNCQFKKGYKPQIQSESAKNVTKFYFLFFFSYFSASAKNGKNFIYQSNSTPTVSTLQTNGNNLNANNLNVSPSLNLSFSSSSYTPKFNESSVVSNPFSNPFAYQPNLPQTNSLFDSSSSPPSIQSNAFSNQSTFSYHPNLQSR